MSKLERPTFLTVPAAAPTAYWEDWAHRCGAIGFGWALIATTRIGADGASDAVYIRDRMASGLWTAHIAGPAAEQILFGNES